VAGESKAVIRDEDEDKQEAECDVEAVFLGVAVEMSGVQLVGNEDDEPRDSLKRCAGAGIVKKRVGHWRVEEQSSFPGAHKHYWQHFYSPSSPAMIKLVLGHEGRQKRGRPRQFTSGYRSPNTQVKRRETR